MLYALPHAYSADFMMPELTLPLTDVWVSVTCLTYTIFLSWPQEILLMMTMTKSVNLRYQPIVCDRAHSACVLIKQLIMMMKVKMKMMKLWEWAWLITLWWWSYDTDWLVTLVYLTYLCLRLSMCCCWSECLRLKWLDFAICAYLSIMKCVPLMMICWWSLMIDILLGVT